MRLLPTDQKDQIKVAVGVAAAALAALYWTYPHAEAVAANDETRAHVEKLEAQNAKAERELSSSRLAALTQEAARSKATLDVLRRLVPTEHEVPALLEAVSTAGRRAGLELGGVQPEPVLPGGAFDTYRYKITLTGNYHALATFLANVGSLPRIVAPVTFELLPAPNAQQAALASGKPAQRAKKETSLQAKLTIQTYVMHTGTPTPAGAASGARPATATTTVVRGGEVAP